jgi:hypothetical protein
MVMTGDTFQWEFSTEELRWHPSKLNLTQGMFSCNVHSFHYHGSSQKKKVPMCGEKVEGRKQHGRVKKLSTGVNKIL